MIGKEQYLIDTNILIYFFDGKLSEKQRKTIIELFEQSFNISVISKIEFFGFKDFFDNEKYANAKEFVSNANIISLSDDLIDKIIEIKQQWNLKLGDAIIGATAIANSCTIVTRNQKDFEKIAGLKIINPLNE